MENIRKIIENTKPNTIIEILDGALLEKYVNDNLNGDIAILKIRSEDLFGSGIDKLLEKMKITHCYTADEEKRRIIIMVNDTKENIAKIRKQIDEKLIKFVE